MKWSLVHPDRHDIYGLEFEEKVFVYKISDGEMHIWNRGETKLYNASSEVIRDRLKSLLRRQVPHNSEWEYGG